MSREAGEHQKGFEILSLLDSLKGGYKKNIIYLTEIIIQGMSAVISDEFRN
jgi:hypothetical protein